MCNPRHVTAGGDASGRWVVADGIRCSRPSRRFQIVVDKLGTTGKSAVYFEVFPATRSLPVFWQAATAWTNDADIPAAVKKLVGYWRTRRHQAPWNTPEFRRATEVSRG